MGATADRTRIDNRRVPDRGPESSGETPSLQAAIEESAEKKSREVKRRIIVACPLSGRALPRVRKRSATRVLLLQEHGHLRPRSHEYAIGVPVTGVP